MKNFLSRRRYELLALAIALVFSAVHLWADAKPPVGLIAGKPRSLALTDAVLRGIQALEGRATDFQFRLRGERSPHPDVVVVAIDEKSAQRYGLWPWPRTRIAAAIRNLHAAGAKAIGLDITFTDAASDDPGAAYRQLLDRFDQVAASDPQALTRFAGFRQELADQLAVDPDLELARAFEAAPQVVQGVITYPEEDVKEFPFEKVKEHIELLRPRVISRAPGAVPGSEFELPLGAVNGWAQYSAQTPLPIFARGPTRFGHFNMVPDADGTLRRTPIWAKLSGAEGLLPSLALATAATYFGVSPQPAYEPSTQLIAGAWLRPAGRPPILVPYQSLEPFTLINHLGPSSRFRTLSITDVIEGTFEAEDVAGKAVLVGVTLVGNSGDQRVTPFKELEPGIYSHAALVSNILTGDFLTRPGWLVLVEVLVMLGAGLLLGRQLPRTRAYLYKALLMGGALSAWLAVDQALFARGLVLATVLPSGSILATSFGLIFLGYLSVDREKLKLRATFSRYLGEDVMEEALKHPEKLNQGEKREMTVLFSDIRGFTTLSERMVPEKLAKFIKEYLSPMTQIVFDQKGTLDKYIGDAVMAFWNAPLDQPDHAVRACRAAVGFLAKLEELKQRWRAESLPEFDIGVGINSGPMIVGNMGSDVRVDYTVMGDAVNLASRLEGTNKEYETRIIISETTYQQAKDEVIARRLGAVRVKGKRKPVGIYELRGIGRAAGIEAEAIRHFEAALEAYTERRFEEAEALFQKTLELWPEDPPSRRYLEELASFKEQPPGPGWDGVFTAKTK